VAATSGELVRAQGDQPLIAGGYGSCGGLVMGRAVVILCLAWRRTRGGHPRCGQVSQLEKLREGKPRLGAGQRQSWR
jgi:hypothetical protein